MTYWCVFFFFEVETRWNVEPHFKLDTAFRASWGPVGGSDSDPTVNIGFLCEYDALPGIGHACDHNLTAEAGAVAAVGLRAALKSVADRPVRVKVTVLGTPAEEEGGGKIDLLPPSQEDATYIPDVAEHESLLSICPAMDWRPVQGVSCLPPEDCWDRLQHPTPRDPDGEAA
ncbi:hypothetical protein SRHO_G00073460 [Serrasalmus rhombeus]